MGGARDWVVRYMGEATAKAIERVAAVVLGDDQFVVCSSCRTPVPANLVSEWGYCPSCREATDKLSTDALFARRDAALERGDEARKEVDEINSLLAARRGQD
jgi:hypothetical protein